jgi:hypothetical protein
LGRLIVLGLTAQFMLGAQTYTRGVGIYPGDPRQNFAADLVPETQTYRNLALHRRAYQSSAYDYNLTAQLITDGIKDAHLPRWVSVATSDQGVLSKQDRENVLDHNSTSTVTLNGARGWLQLELLGGDGPLELDSLELAGLRASADAQKPAGWSIVVTGSDDGLNWTGLGRAANPDRPPAGFRGFGPGAPSGPPPVFAVAFTAPSHSRRIRIEPNPV